MTNRDESHENNIKAQLLIPPGIILMYSMWKKTLDALSKWHRVAMVTSRGVVVCHLHRAPHALQYATGKHIRCTERPTISSGNGRVSFEAKGGVDMSLARLIGTSHVTQGYPSFIKETRTDTLSRYGHTCLHIHMPVHTLHAYIGACLATWIRTHMHVQKTVHLTWYPHPKKTEGDHN